MNTGRDAPFLPSLPRTLLLIATWIAWVGLTGSGMRANPPGAGTDPSSPSLSQPAQKQNQEAMPELGVFDADDLNNALDPGQSEALGEASLLGE